MKTNYLFLSLFLLTITAFAQPVNDSCNNSQNISISTTATTVGFTIANSAINNEIGCSGTTAANYVDVWYDFTMPFNGNVYVDAKISWNKIAVYDACNGTQIKCENGNAFITGLTSGSNYKLRIFRTEADASNSFLDFSIKAYEDAENNDCASSQNINVSETTTNIDFAIGGSTITNGIGCSGTTAANYVDVWYDFTMPVNGNLSVNGAISWNNFALYNACGGTQIQCGSGSQVFTGLASGTNYKLRLFRTEDLAANAFTSFTTQAFEIINNDDCASAENITVTNTPTTINFGIGGATINNEVGCFGTTAADYADIWYDFTMPMNGYLLVKGSIAWNNFALYDACGGTQLGCFAGDGNFAELTGGETYKLRVFRTLANAENNGFKSFTISTTTTLTLDTISLEKKINIYPNPANSSINIESLNPVKEVRVFDAMGKKVLQVQHTKQINMNPLNAGLYILKIQTKEGELTKKIIKI